MIRLNQELKHLITGIVCIMLMASCNSKPKEVEVIQNYGTGEVSRRYVEVDGKKEGLMTDYYPGGQIKAERYFENDKQVGKRTIYYENGKVKEVQHYVNDMLQGGDTIFYEGGKPEFVITFDKGLKNGYLRKWNAEGAMIYEAKYLNDTLVEVHGQPVMGDSHHHSPLLDSIYPPKN